MLKSLYKIKKNAWYNMTTNKKEFLKVVKKDFPEFIDDQAIIEDAERQLCFKDNVEFYIFRNNNQIINLYDFKTLKNYKKRFLKQKVNT